MNRDFRIEPKPSSLEEVLSTIDPETADLVRLAAKKQSAAAHVVDCETGLASATEEMIRSHSRDQASLHRAVEAFVKIADSVIACEDQGFSNVFSLTAEVLRRLPRSTWPLSAETTARCASVVRHASAIEAAEFGYDPRPTPAAPTERLPSEATLLRIVCEPGNLNDEAIADMIREARS